MRSENIVSLIGDTPIVRVNGLSEKNIKLYAKLEYENPFGSAKDRPAYYMIKGALERGDMTPDSVIIEPTSGNTGLALAAIASSMGIRSMIVMPETMSDERKALIKAFGAELVLTPGKLGMKGAVDKANELHAAFPGSFIPDQFGNPDNARAHYETTGPEIMRDLPEVDVLVATIGTGGTITGTGRYLKALKPEVEVVGVEPYESPLLTEGKAGPHKIQGIGANFIPSVLDRKVLDRVVTVKGDDAIGTSRRAMRKSGIFGGISSGASLAAALKIAEEDPEKTVLCILTDTGERYLSSPLFKD